MNKFNTNPDSEQSVLATAYVAANEITKIITITNKNKKNEKQRN